MAHPFDKNYWDETWTEARSGALSTSGPNPHLVAEVAGLQPGTALDAGCGAGAEAIWLADHGWEVTAADVAEAALEVAEQRAAAAGLAERVRWVLADLGTWWPETAYDLVTTHYAHPSIGQLAFYQRVSEWVAPGGTLLVVGHLSHHGQPDEASVGADQVTALLDAGEWDVTRSREVSRTVAGPGGRPVTLHDVVVKAVRR